MLSKTKDIRFPLFIWLTESYVRITYSYYQMLIFLYRLSLLFTV